MKAIQIRHARAAERRAQVALAEAIGAKVYHDPAGNTFAVSSNGREFARMQQFDIITVPTDWSTGAADPIGGREATDATN